MQLKIPNNKTSLCISLAAFPGNTGSKLHNFGYKILKLNFLYLPLKCKNKKEALNIIKNLKFTGCSLSMPLKQKLTKYIHNLDKISKVTGSVNTILKKKNKLYGFNTDYYALKRLIKEKKINYLNSRVILLGNGGVAKTSFQVLKDLKFKHVFLSSRNKTKYKDWNLNKNFKIINWSQKNKTKTNVLINATSIGMRSKKSPISDSAIINNNIIVDFPINPQKNSLEIKSKKFKIDYVSGYLLSFYQGIKQFNIYTGKLINEKKLKKYI